MSVEGDGAGENDEEHREVGDEGPGADVNAPVEQLRARRVAPLRDGGAPL